MRFLWVALMFACAARACLPEGWPELSTGTYKFATYEGDAIDPYPVSMHLDLERRIMFHTFNHSRAVDIVSDAPVVRFECYRMQVATGQCVRRFGMVTYEASLAKFKAGLVSPPRAATPCLAADYVANGIRFRSYLRAFVPGPKKHLQSVPAQCVLAPLEAK